MTDQDSLESLRGLHQDLNALDQNRLRNVDKLWVDLDARVVEFRKLLDKSPKNEKSRRTLQTGMYTSRIAFAVFRRNLRLTRAFEQGTSRSTKRNILSMTNLKRTRYSLPMLSTWTKSTLPNF